MIRLADLSNTVASTSSSARNVSSVAISVRVLWGRSDEHPRTTGDQTYSIATESGTPPDVCVSVVFVGRIGMDSLLGTTTEVAVSGVNPCIIKY